MAIWFKRKQHIAIAKTIRNADLSKKDLNKIVKEFCGMLKEDNPLFDIKAFTSITNGDLDDDPRLGYLFFKKTVGEDHGDAD